MLTINSHGKVGAAVIIDRYCVVKHLLRDEVLTFNDDFIPVDANKNYNLTADFKTNNPDLKYFAGIAKFDIDKNLIESPHVSYIEGTLTTLTQDLKKGDTIVYLNSTSNFDTSSTLYSYQLGLIFWNYKDSTGHLYGPETYSRNVFNDIYLSNSVNKTNNTITLKNPWNKETVKAGTDVSQSNAFSGTYNYGLINNENLGTNFQSRSLTISSTNNPSASQSFNNFRNSTKFIKFLVLNNFNSSGNGTLSIRNISLKEVK